MDENYAYYLAAFRSKDPTLQDLVEKLILAARYSDCSEVVAEQNQKVETLKKHYQEQQEQDLRQLEDRQHWLNDPTTVPDPAQFGWTSHPHQSDYAWELINRGF